MGGFSSWNIFSRHKKIERFMFRFFMIGIPLVLMTFVSIYNKFGLDHQQLSENATYTTKVTFSRTQLSGDVAGIYTNKDHTKGMVLIKMSDSTKISSQAKDYKVFTTAVNLKQQLEPIASQPSGSIYVFGTSGYIGLYFVDNAGFKSQIFKSTIRAEKELTVVDDANVSKEMESTSYAKYDQADVYFNLGATKTKVLKSLDGNDLSAQDVYIEAIGSQTDEKLKTKLNDDLLQLSKLNLQIKELKSRLESMSADGVGIVVPNLPKEIASDSFSTDGNDVMMTTDFVYAGGLNFNWRTVDVTKGYFNAINNDQVNPDHLSLTRWSVQMSQATINSTDMRSYSTDDWVMSDGTSLQKFVSDLGANNSAVQGINETVLNYQQLMNSYLDLKYQYQTKDLMDLVLSDITLENATSNVDSISDKHFFIY